MGTRAVRGALGYPNDNAVSDRVLGMVAAADPPPTVVVLDLGLSPDLDVQSADMLADRQAQLAALGAALRLAVVRAPAREVLRRAGVTDRVPVTRTVDEALD